VKDKNTDDGGRRRNSQEDPIPMEQMFLTVGVGKTPVVVELKIMGQTFTNTIVDGGSEVNVLPEDK